MEEWLTFNMRRILSINNESTVDTTVENSSSDGDNQVVLLLIYCFGIIFSIFGIYLLGCCLYGFIFGEKKKKKDSSIKNDEEDAGVPNQDLNQREDSKPTSTKPKEDVEMIDHSSPRVSAENIEIINYPSSSAFIESKHAERITCPVKDQKLDDRVVSDISIPIESYEQEIHKSCDTSPSVIASSPSIGGSPISHTLIQEKSRADDTILPPLATSSPSVGGSTFSTPQIQEKREPHTTPSLIVASSPSVGGSTCSTPQIQEKRSPEIQKDERNMDYAGSVSGQYQE